MHRASPRWTSSSSLSTDRVEMFTDGVFAIVITLLVLDLKVPPIEESKRPVAEQLLSGVLHLWPNYLSYALSFIVVGIYWVGHHNLFHHMKRTDRWLLWLNLIFLMFVVLIPFPTALMAEYPGQWLPVVIYGANHVFAGLFINLMWFYASYRRRLLRSDVEPIIVRMVWERIIPSPISYLIAVGLAFFDTRLSLALYALIPIIYLLPMRLDRYFSPVQFDVQPQAESLASLEEAASTEHEVRVENVEQKEPSEVS